MKILYGLTEVAKHTHAASYAKQARCKQKTTWESGYTLYNAKVAQPENRPPIQSHPLINFMKIATACASVLYNDILIVPQ